MERVTEQVYGETQGDRLKMQIPIDISKTDIVNAIDEWIVGQNAERNRKLMYRRLIDGITYERLAEEFDLSVTQTKSIVYKCEKRIFKHIPGF